MSAPKDNLAAGKKASRDSILARVREALAVPAKLRPLSTNASPEVLKEYLPTVGSSLDERLALFEQHSEALKTNLVLLGTTEDAGHFLMDLAEREGWKKAAYHPFDGVQPCIQRLACDTMQIEGEYDARELERCDAGITGCDALVAQTGSVLVTSKSAGGRALSVLPPHHVVIANRSQLIADLPDAFALLRQRYDGAWPSFMSLISGPSRTGDIERILVLGAHGPKKLTVVIVNDR